MIVIIPLIIFVTFFYVKFVVHNHLMEEYGLPTWGSYLIFAIATILLGALLGLILVGIIDCVYPPKMPAKSVPAEAQVETNKLTDKSSDEELADEDIRDDLLDDASSPSEDEVAHLNKSPSRVRKRNKTRKAD